MNWNIQNFGRTKAGLNFNNGDVVAAIAKTVADAEVDIFVMLEVNTTSEATARELASTMREALQAAEQDLTLWEIAVISPNTGREFYAFFIRDRRVLEPLPIVGPIIPQYNSPPEVLGQMRPIANAIFAEQLHDYDVLDAWFPLLAPDVNYVLQAGRVLGVPTWPAIRRPVLGLFHVKNVAGATSVLPIIACHFAPAATVASQQFRVLPFFSLLNGLAPQPSVLPVALNLIIGGVQGQHAPSYYALTGDFNIDYPAGAYAPITGNARDQLGATAHITNQTVLPDTMLMTYRQYIAQRPHNTAAFAVSNFDNWFVRRSAARPTVPDIRHSEVYNIPEDVRLRDLELDESVRHYQELDQRGFSSGDYPTLVRDYAGALTNPTRMVNYTAALIGGRLISDHLPSVMDIRLT